MKYSKRHSMTKWLNERISILQQALERAKQTKNYGMQAHYSGMIQAFEEIIKKLTTPPTSR